LEDLVRKQKGDRYGGYNTIPQRLEALKVVRALSHDINTRYETTKEVLSAQRKLDKEKLDRGADSDRSPSKYPDQDNLLNYTLPAHLRGGASFTLWPPKSYHSTSALRVNYRGGPGGVASSSVSKNVTTIRWEWENQTE
jgi:hypothetical protein